MPTTHTHPPSAIKAHGSEHARVAGGHYIRLLVMTALSFAAMYVLMYAMVDRFANVYNSINQVYMAGLMAAAMVVIELGVMGAMYRNTKLNVAIIAASIAALAAFWVGIRQQSAVLDQQFLRSMIPHHAGAILMCEQATIRDAEIRELCQTIIASQADEIRQMKAKLEELGS
jgi:uncharacterized protein (DUF305 family)